MNEKIERVKATRKRGLISECEKNSTIIELLENLQEVLIENHEQEDKKELDRIRLIRSRINNLKIENLVSENLSIIESINSNH